MEIHGSYDIAVIGGGLAGLALSIQMVRKGYSVVLFEKEAYPFHKVCGEYVSMESWNFLQSIGLPVAGMQLPKISRLVLTAPNGRSFTTPLPLGGFGISRYRMDGLLAGIAVKEGVHLVTRAKVEQVDTDEDFIVKVHSGGKEHSVRARLCFGAYGKKSNLDIKWKRSFLEQQDRKVNNYVGIKYHIRTSWDPSLIGLHNFKNGYCGISAIEENKYCLCYMTHADNLKACGNQIVELEKRFLHRNPHLQKIFEGSEFLEGFPVTISQINFSGKSKVRNGVIFLGDAAGTITPLCGNGMSMALHSSKLAAECSIAFLEGWISRGKMEHDFSKAWQKQFSHRLLAGRTIQKFFGAEALSNFFVGSFRKLPFLARPVIRLTHGKPF